MRADTRATRRYGNPPKIKMMMPTAATAAAAKPIATVENGADGVPVTATTTAPGSMKV